MAGIKSLHGPNDCNWHLASRARMATTALPLGCVKTPKGRPLRGIAFFRWPGSGRNANAHRSIRGPHRRFFYAFQSRPVFHAANLESRHVNRVAHDPEQTLVLP
jgi:hypothetical protein